MLILLQLTVFHLENKTALHSQVPYFYLNLQRAKQLQNNVTNEASLTKYWRSKSRGTELFALWLFHHLKYVRNKVKTL